MYGRMAGTACIGVVTPYETRKSDWWMLPGRACQLVPNYGVDSGATLCTELAQSSTRLNSTQLSGNTNTRRVRNTAMQWSGCEIVRLTPKLCHVY